MWHKTYLADVDGDVFVFSDAPAHDVPEVIRQVYATGLRWRDLRDFYGIEPGQDDLTFNTLYKRFEMVYGPFHKRLFVETTGDYPIRVERIPIPCPKVRKGIETRYRYGQWQKLLRSGWTAA